MPNIQVYLKNGRTVIKESGSNKSEIMPVNFRIDDSRKVVYITSVDNKRSWEAAYDEILDQLEDQVDATGSDYDAIEDYMSLNAVFNSSTGGSVDNSVIFPIYSSGEVGSSGVDYWKRPPAKYYHFGHNWRFCGITGGYTDGSAYYDIDGVATTRALAFPEGLVCDLGHVDAEGNFLMWQIDPELFALSNYTDAVTNCEGFSIASFTSNFRMPTIVELSTLFYSPNTGSVNQSPFENATLNISFWSSTTGATGYWSFRNQQTQTFPGTVNTVNRAFPVRITNLTEIL